VSALFLHPHIIITCCFMKHKCNFAFPNPTTTKFQPEFPQPSCIGSCPGYSHVQMKLILHMDNCSLFTVDHSICFELWYICVLHTLQTCMIITNFIKTFPPHKNHLQYGCNTHHNYTHICNHSHCLKYWLEIQIPFPLIHVHNIHIMASYLIQVYDYLQSLSAKKIFSTYMQYIPLPSELLTPKQCIPYSTDIHPPYTIMPSTKPRGCTMLRTTI